MQRFEKFVTVFGASVWLKMITVFALTSAFFWCSANYPGQMVEKESKTLYKMQGCMYSAWRLWMYIYFNSYEITFPCVTVTFITTTNIS